MTLPASPYAVFHPEQWNSLAAQPIGIGQCLRITPKKYYRRNSSLKKKTVNDKKIKHSNVSVQLSFA